MLFSLSPQHTAIAAVNGHTHQVERTWLGEPKHLDGPGPMAGANQISYDASSGLLFISGGHGLWAVDPTEFEIVERIAAQGSTPLLLPGPGDWMERTYLGTVDRLVPLRIR